jgi:hypothetical protein
MDRFEDVERGEEGDRYGEEPERTPVAENATWLAVIVGTLIASLTFRVLGARGLEHTSVVFIGIPAIIAVTIVLMPRPKSVTGVILKAITLSLAVASIVFGEGFVCILFAAPLFYFVGIVIGLAADWRRRVDERDNRINGTVMVVLLVLGPSSLEGVIPGFEFGRDATVTRTRVVEGSASDVEAALARAPRFDRELPAFFKLGFPTPGVTGGEGLAIGAERRVEFQHGGHHPGTLVLRVASRGPRSVTFRPAHDDSYITHWLSWRDIDVEWREVAPGKTEVSWTLRYRRRLDPAWYFAPLERYATGLAAGYLIDTLATPSTHASRPERDTPVLPGSTSQNTNPSPWDQGEGQGRGFEPSADHHAAATHVTP